jgi:hypothetical protein
MTDVSKSSKELGIAAREDRPQYEAPRITVMISAAGCWWMTGGGSR